MKSAKLARSILLVVATLAVLSALITLAWVISPLHKAEMLYGSTVSKDYAGMTEWIRRGADVDFLFDGTTSPLQAAIEGEDAKATAILLIHGASLRTLSSHHERALSREPFRSKVLSDLRASGKPEAWPKTL